MSTVFFIFLNFFKNFFNLLFLPHSQRPHLHLQIFRKQQKNRPFFIFLHLFDFDGWQILLGVFIMHVTKNTDKPMRKKSIWPMYRHREFRMVETERLTVSEWTSEGSLERLWIVSVGADGTPPVIHRARMMVREASGRHWRQFGWYRRSLRFCPMYRDRGVF